MLGGNDDEQDESTDTDDVKHMDDTETSFAIVGVRNKKRSVAAGGVKLTPQKKTKKNEELLQYVGTMTDHLGSISKTMAESKIPPQSRELLTKADVIEIVNENMRPTNEMIAHISSTVDKLARLRE